MTEARSSPLRGNDSESMWDSSVVTETIIITGEPLRAVLDINWSVGEDEKTTEVVPERCVPVWRAFYPVIVPTHR